MILVKLGCQAIESNTLTKKWTTKCTQECRLGGGNYRSNKGENHGEQEENELLFQKDHEAHIVQSGDLVLKEAEVTA